MPPSVSMNLLAGGLRLWFGILAGLVSASAGTLSQAQIVSLQLGIAQHLRLGEWAPITLELGSDPALLQATRLEVESVDGDGLPAVYEQVPLRDELAPQRLAGWFRLGSSRGEVRVRLFGPEGNLLGQSERAVSPGAVNRPEVLPLTTRLIAVVGVAPAARELFAWSRTRGDSLRLVFLESLRELPPTALGLRNLDTLVLSGSDPEVLGGLDSQRQAVVTSWIRAGGKLVFWTAGSSAGDFRPGGRLADLIPGELLGFERLTSTARLDFLLKAKQPLIPLGQPGVEFGRLGAEVGNVLAAQEQVPLVVRRQFGLGQLTFSALTLDREPLLSWEATPRLIDSLVTQTRVGEERNSEVRAVAAGGMQQDLIEQLRQPLETFQNVSLISFTTVALLIGLLLLVVGPADYFLLRTLPGNRMEWTWLTFPLIVAGFSGLAWWLSARSHPAELQFNQVEVVDIDTATGRQRGVSWTAVYSPRAETHRVAGQLVPGLPVELLDEQVSWLALPSGTALGQLGGNQSPYIHRGKSSGDDLKVELEGFPFPVRSTRTLVYNWQGKSQLPVRSQLRFEPGVGRLAGTFTNPFAFPLRNFRIYFEGWAYVFEQPLEAGDTVDLASESRERTIKSILTQRDRASAEGKSQNAPWDPRETKLSRLLEMLMFHESAGGQRYTGLVNRAQGRLEMSEHLDLKQAIVVAEIPQPLSRLQIDGVPLEQGADQRYAVVRLSLPVEFRTGPERSGP